MCVPAALSPPPPPARFARCPPPAPGGGLILPCQFAPPLSQSPPLPPAYSACPLPLPEGALKCSAAVAHQRTYSPSPTPTPGLFGLPPPTPGGGFDYFVHYHSTHLLCVCAPPRSSFCLCSAYRLPASRATLWLAGSRTPSQRLSGYAVPGSSLKCNS